MQPIVVRPCAQADFPPRVHDALPRNPLTLRESMEGVSDLAGMPWKSRQLGDLAIGRHSPPGDAPNDLVNPLVGAHAANLSCAVAHSDLPRYGSTLAGVIGTSDLRKTHGNANP